MELEPMTKMPKKAISIAMIIRKAVKRPKVTDFDWTGSCWRTKIDGCCPMGMHPKAISSAPVTHFSFPPSRNDTAIRTFFRFWDSLKEHQLKDAINAVWGKKK